MPLNNQRVKEEIFKKYLRQTKMETQHIKILGHFKRDAHSDKWLPLRNKISIKQPNCIFQGKRAN